MQKLIDKLTYYALYLLSLLPFRALYCLSDCAYFFVYKIFGYRKKLVRNHLQTAFPEKSDAERRDIERKFYHWFCDYFFEAIKLLSISRKELEKRFTITNSNEIEQCFQEGQSVGTILGHYCNWEWLSCVGIGLPDNRAVGLVYKPLKSHAMDEVFIRLRSCVGGMPVPKNDILRALVRLKQSGTMSIFGYIADQGPKWENIHLWLTFLNHETPVFTGSERIMRKMNNAVFYVEMSRPKRGYYTCTYHLITRHPQEMEEYAITREFFKRLEQTIRKNPEFYLWTHNRWKRTREEFERRFTIENGRVIPKS